MPDSRRPPLILHTTSQPLRFFGRTAELALLDQALASGPASVVGFVGPGGQGKTAIVQHWLTRIGRRDDVDGLFFWSFYRGKDSDLCLRELWAYAVDGGRVSEGESAGVATLAQVSASYCVDQLLPILRRERWAIALDGTEVVQHEQGGWAGRFVHPELGRLVEELASAPMPGVLALTTRFELPTLTHRRHARLLTLDTLDLASACDLLRCLGVHGDASALEQAAQTCGLHAKAVELLGTWLRHFHQGQARQQEALPTVEAADASAEERSVARVLTGFQRLLAQETRDILALTTAFRQPPNERRLREYLASPAVHHLVHEVWGRSYLPLGQRPARWLAEQIQELVDLRLLERVGLTLGEPDGDSLVLDAHPLVRRGFEQAGDVSGAAARAGFLRGRPDRRPPASLEEAREEVELFHALCDAGLWNDADSAFLALDNPKHRFVAPAFERDLLLRFFPQGDWRQTPLWPGFGRYRNLAICLEMLGQYEDALAVYPARDAPLRGDALLALGRLQPFVDQPMVGHPWQSLWQAYRVHALALLERDQEAVRLAQTLVPVDVYEWVHVVEGLMRLDRLDLVDMQAMLYRGPLEEEHRWARLARRRMQADVLRRAAPQTPGLEDQWRELLEEYDQTGLPLERAWTRLSMARWLGARVTLAGASGSAQAAEAQVLAAEALDLARRHHLATAAIDALEILGEVTSECGFRAEALERRAAIGYQGGARP